MKKIKTLITVLFILAVVLSIAVFFSKPEIKFMAQSLFESKTAVKLNEISVADYNFTYVQPENLKYGRNCTFDQSLILVNKKHSLSESFEAEIEQYENTDAYINACAVDSFIEMREYISKEFGSRLLIMSAYRNSEEQREIYSEDKDSVAAKPGESEHETGLGIDVYVKNFAGMGFIKSEIGQYVNENCGKFGFIIRYPLGKKSVTGFSFEPWHVRYVGLPHSKIISSNSLTLEEYIETLELDKFYSYENYIISRQDGDEVIIPDEYISLTISPDNLGCYIVTAKIR